MKCSVKTTKGRKRAEDRNKEKKIKNRYGKY